MREISDKGDLWIDVLNWAKTISNYEKISEDIVLSTDGKRYVVWI